MLGMGTSVAWSESKDSCCFGLSSALFEPSRDFFVAGFNLVAANR